MSNASELSPTTHIPDTATQLWFNGPLNLHDDAHTLPRPYGILSHDQWVNKLMTKVQENIFLFAINFKITITDYEQPTALTVRQPLPKSTVCQTPSTVFECGKIPPPFDW